MENSPNTSRWWDWASVVFLFILVQIAASRLVTTSWTDDLYLVQIAAYMGFTVGVSLGYTRFSIRVSRWISFLYMAILTPLLLTLVTEQSTSLEEQFSSLTGRLYYSYADFFARRPVEDAILFISLVTVGFWLLGSSAGFQLIRKNKFIASALPSAAALTVIQSYDNAVSSRIWIMALFGLFSLLLLGRLYYLENKESWKKRHIFVSPDNRIDLTGGMAIAATLIILFSWTPPASSSGLDGAVKFWNKVTKPWRTFTEKVENAVNPLESPSGGKRGEFYGSELILGHGFPLSDTLMLTVEAPPLSFNERPPRYYWRGRTYDYFVGGQWYTTGSSLESFSPEDAIFLPEDAQLSHFIIRTGDETFSLLYAPSETLWVSRPGSRYMNNLDRQREIVSWFAYPSLQSGETYQLDAILDNPDIQQLTEAGTDYPQVITDKYLQLPEGFSPALAELAQEITDGMDTPYEKSTAITRYLRSTIEYAEIIPDPPRGKDLLEWIVLEYKKAYCVYYSSAEILMLRSLGIPARLAVGFSEGGRDGNIYTVRKYDAHAWPEVYFPGIGWVEFEPTASQPALNRPLPSSGASDANLLDKLPDLLDLENNPEERAVIEETLDTSTLSQEGNGLVFDLNQLLLPIAIIILILAFYFGRRYSVPVRIPALLRSSYERSGIQPPQWIVSWEQWVQTSPIQRAFESINFSLKLLDRPMPIDATPIERAKRLGKILPKSNVNIMTLLDEHQTSLYTSRKPDFARARRAGYHLRWQALIERTRYFFEGKSIENL